MEYKYKTKGTCSAEISFDLNNNIVTNIKFLGCCPGNTNALSKVLDGQTTDFIIDKLLGNQCGMRGTSCADQLCKAIIEAKNNEEKN